jgi:flagellar hook protein FlgE
MGLQSAMTTALTGLQAAETTIDVVGNNVANSNTVGFKESNVLFATQFLQTQSIGSAPSASAGGTNPRQIGLGVKVSEIAPNFTQGTIQVSANPLDLAIQGDGFFLVQGPNGGAQQFYTRNGQFKTNAVNELVSINGNRVLGYGITDEFIIDTNTVEPLSIPLGGSAVAQETDNVTLVGNLLPDNEQISTQPGIIDSVILNDNSVEIPTDFAISDLQQLNAPTTGTATPNAPGSGAVDAGTYSYKVVFVDPAAAAGHDEAPPSIAFGSATSDGTQSIALTGLPTSTDPAVFTMKRIYRSDGTSPYEFVAEIPEANLTYTDNTTSGALGAALNEDSLDLGANYSYFVTFSKPGLETRPTSETATITISVANRRIRLEDIPQPTDPTFTNINIYRSVRTQPGNYYRVDSLAVGETAYVDNTPDDDIIAAATLLDRNGPPVNTALELTKVATFDGTNYVDLFQPGTLQFTGSKGPDGGLDLAMKEMSIDGTTTVQDLINFMQQALGIQLTSPDPAHPLSGSPGGSLLNSRLHFESNEGIFNAVSVNQNAFRLIDPTGSPQTIPLNFSTTEEADGAGTSSEMIVYDSLGIPLTVRLTTALESTTDGVTTYRWFATSPDNQAPSGVSTTVGTGLITFDGNGKFISATEDGVSIDRRDVASNSPVTFALNFSQITALAESADSHLQASSQDGFAAGTLSTFSITETGRIKGVYSNGVTRDLGQLLMARFNNPGGLQQVGNNLFAEGVNSGEALRDIPGSSGIGSLTAGAVELSNTDIGQNLIDLILASTQYRGGTRVITSAQQLLDELLNLRR